jgi:hypothetical protein
MNQKTTNLLAAFKTTDAFGIKYAADFPAASLGGQQFALVHTAVTQTATLGATQISGGESAHSGVLSKAAGRLHLRADMLGITDAVHSLVLLGNTSMAGKFLMPHSNGDQALLNTARAFATDAVPFTAQFVSVGLPATFITTLNADITALETAISSKGTGTGTQSGATGGLEDTTHKAAVALHVLNTIVANLYKNNPTRLAEWASASHVEKHAPVPRPPVTPPVPIVPIVTPTPTPKPTPVVTNS